MSTAAHKQAAKGKLFAVASMMDRKDNTIKSMCATCAVRIGLLSEAVWKPPAKNVICTCCNLTAHEASRPHFSLGDRPFANSSRLAPVLRTIWQHTREELVGYVQYRSLPHVYFLRFVRRLRLNRRSGEFRDAEYIYLHGA